MYLIEKIPINPQMLHLVCLTTFCESSPFVEDSKSSEKDSESYEKDFKVSKKILKVQRNIQKVQRKILNQRTKKPHLWSGDLQGSGL